MDKLRDCPFCGSSVDPEGWLAADGIRGPECNGCGATADSVDAWERRVAELGVRFPESTSPKEIFEHHVINPNLFRSLAVRLKEYATFIKVAGYPMEEGTIGPDCIRTYLLLMGMADAVEESKDD